MEKDIVGRASSDNDGIVSTSPPNSSNDNPSGIRANSRNDTDSYPPTREVIPIMFATSIVFLLVTLDRNIIATAIPKISDEFNSIQDIGWYASAYTLTGSAFMLLFAKIYTFYPAKWVMLSAIFLFEIGSAVCGSAPSSIAFIIGRAIAGWGFSGIFTGGIVVFQRIMPLHKRPVVMGIMGSVSSISAVAGPVIGGALTSKASWRWCFYLNLPLGAIAMIIFAIVLKATAPVEAGATFKTKISQLDPFGTLCFLPGIICLLLALQLGGQTYPWSNTRIIILFILFGILILSFIGIQIKKKDLATVPPHILKQRSVACGFIYVLCSGGSMFLMVYYLPIYFQVTKNVDALQSGFDILAFLLSLTAASFIAGFLVTKIGYYTPFMILGPVAMAVGAGLMTTFLPGTSKGKWIGYQILFGFGVGLGNQQPNIAAQAVLEKKDVAIGSSLMMWGMQMAGAVFVPIGQSVFEGKLVEGLKGIEGVDVNAVMNAGATEVRNVVGEEVLERVLLAYNQAVARVFLVALVFSCLAVVPALGMEWKSVEKDKAKDIAGMTKRDVKKKEGVVDEV